MKKTILAILVCLISLTVISFSMADAPAMPSTGIYTGNATAIRIQKDIVVTNTDSAVTKVFGPTIEYSYMLGTPEVTATITDGNSNSISVKKGIASAVALENEGKVAFTGAEVALTDGKATVSGFLTLTITPSAFNAPGVYRYSLSDSTSQASLSEAGILRKNNYAATYYMDVYCGYKENAERIPEQLEVQGVVLTTANTDISAESAKKSGYDTTTEGSQFTVSDSELTNSGCDLYPTFNMKITKKVEGSLADATHPFPFVLTLGGTGTRSFYSGKVSEAKNASSNTLASSLTLCHGESFWLVGLNATTTVAVSETNDTADPYAVSAKNKTNGEITLTKNTTAKTAATSALALTAAASAGIMGLNANNTEILFINSLNAVSPTGVILHIGPYFILLAFAFLFIVFLKRGKKEEAVQY